MAELDHFVLATPDLAATTAAVGAAIGVTPSPGGRHVGVGTANTLLALGGGAYLEIIGPDPTQDAVEGPLPFGIDDLAGEARLMTFAVHVNDIDATIVRARATGYDPGEARAMQRATTQGDLLAWRLTTPPAWAGGVVPFLIDWGATVHPSTTSAPGATLNGFSVGHPQAARIRDAFAALALDVIVDDAAAPTLQAVVTGPAGPMVLTS